VDNLSPDYAGLLSSPELQEGGLPYWVFYLLLSIILLLVFITFLRNRDLRQKLSYFLAGPQRKFSRLRLRVILKREEEKKTGLLRRLGELASICWPDLLEIKELPDDIRSLEEQDAGLQDQWHHLYQELERLKLEKKRLTDRANPDEDLPGKLEELDKNISILKKNRNDIQQEIMATDELLVPHHETIGKLIYDLRPDHEDLAFIYFQVDSLENNIKEIKEELKKL
jgi:chromosome segregation ATPase